MTEKEAETIAKTRKRYQRSNTKKYSTVRFALLFGIYYELEKAFAKNIVSVDSVESLWEESFEPTNRLRWEVRPTIVWRPFDGYLFKIYPYIKLPFNQAQSIVRAGEQIDSRYDLFFDLQSSLSIKLENDFTIDLAYRYLYDNAPKRKFLPQSDQTFVLLSGQKGTVFFRSL